MAADGLVAALTEQTARAAVPVQLNESGVGRYAADVEAAVYFAVLEALQNVAKYADATHVTIRLSEDQGTLTFEVSDDGAGFDTAATTMGTGIQGIVDRLDTVDGTFTIESTPGKGTDVMGTVPIGVSHRGRRRRHSGGGDPMSTIVRRATFASWVICVVATLASFVLLAMGTGQSTPGDTFVLGGTGGFAFAFAGLAFGTVGALISHRLPENRVGWVFCVIGLALGVGNLVYQYADQVLYASGSGLPGGTAAAVLQNALVPPVFGLVAVALMVFPDGRLPSPRWWPAVATALVGSTFTVIGYILRPGRLDSPFETVTNPFGAAGQFALWDNVSAFGWPVMTVGTVLAAAAMRSRLRRSHGQEREQLKWVAFAASIAGLMIVLDVVSFFAGEEDGTPTVNLLRAIALGIGFCIIPIAAGLAILRYRLYDIDVVISRTLLVAGLAGFITVTYVAIVVGLVPSSAEATSRTSSCRSQPQRSWPWRSSRCGADSSGGEPHGLWAPGDAVRRAERVRDARGRGRGVA